MSIEVDGLDELMIDLDGLNDRFQKALTDDIGPEIAQVMYAQAVKNAPVDTGRLRHSLTTGKAVIEKEGRDEVFIGATTNIEYATYVEYGTGTKGDPAVPHVPKSFWWAPNPDYDPANPDKAPKFIRWYAQAPNPFMGRALSQTEKVALKMMKQGIEAVFE